MPGIQPWTLDAWHDEMDVALKKVNAFQWSTDKQTTNIRFLGWRDSQRGTFQFEFDKPFHDYAIMDCVHALWNAFTDRKTYLDVVACRRQLTSFELLQNVGPNIAIARLNERYPGVVGEVHIIIFIFRVRTSNGIWTLVSSGWLDGNKRGYTFRIGGVMMATDANYGQNWMLEAFGSLLRLERLATGQQLVTSDYAIFQWMIYA